MKIYLRTLNKVDNITWTLTKVDNINWILTRLKNIYETLIIVQKCNIN